MPHSSGATALRVITLALSAAAFVGCAGQGSDISGSGGSPGYRRNFQHRRSPGNRWQRVRWLARDGWD